MTGRLQERIAWINRGPEDIPDAYGDWFYHMLLKPLKKDGFDMFFRPDKDEACHRIWIFKNPSKDKQRVYEMLKNAGYYDWTIRTMIKHIADTQSAHMDKTRSIWISAANQGKESGRSAISTFASQIIYAATKQINGLGDYLLVEYVSETL